MFQDLNLRVMALKLARIKENPGWSNKTLPARVNLRTGPGPMQASTLNIQYHSDLSISELVNQ